MRIGLSLFLGILLVGENAAAGFVPDNMVFTGLRVSYDKMLGVGVGVHGSYWSISSLDHYPMIPPSSTLGAVWYKGLSRQYIGLQYGVFGGVSAGVFAQQGKSGSFTGKYYELWGAYFLGASARQFMKWGEGVRKTPLEWSLFGTFPVLEF